MAAVLILTRKELDEKARKLYDALTTPRPSWDQLGDTTKGLWRDRACDAERAAARAKLPKRIRKAKA